MTIFVPIPDLAGVKRRPNPRSPSDLHILGRIVLSVWSVMRKEVTIPDTIGTVEGLSLEVLFIVHAGDSTVTTVTIERFTRSSPPPDFYAFLMVGYVFLCLQLALNIYTFENVAYHVLHQRIPLYSYQTLTLWYEHRTRLYR